VFANGEKPKKLCSFWLSHHTHCAKGDMCDLAHGLAEMAIDGNDRVVIKTGEGSGAAVTKAMPPSRVRSKGAEVGSGKSGKTSGYGCGTEVARALSSASSVWHY